MCIGVYFKESVKTSISTVYCPFMTINQKLFDLQSSLWYQIKGNYKLYKNISIYIQIILNLVIDLDKLIFLDILVKKLRFP